MEIRRKNERGKREIGGKINQDRQTERERENERIG
jgi:hypothetical protein